jgi:hypothetical protein
MNAEMKLKMDQMKKLIEEENDAAAKHLAEKNLLENSGKVLIEEIENTEKVLVEEIKDLSLGNTENPSVENHENKSSDNVVKILVKEIESLSVKNIENKSAVNGDQSKLLQESEEKALTDENIDFKSAIDSETNLNGETDKKESSNSSKVDVQNDVRSSAKVDVKNDVKNDDDAISYGAALNYVEVIKKTNLT